MSTRLPLRVPPAIMWPIIVAISGFIVWMLSFSPERWRLIPFEIAGQAYLLIAILLAFRYWPPMIRFVQTIAVPHRIVFGVLLGAMILGHFRIDSHTYFPFVSWEIFYPQRADNPVTVHEFIAVRADGSKVRLLVEQQFPSIVQVHPLEKYSPETLEEIARSLAKVYNEHHADNPVKQVDLMVMAVQLHPSPSESRPEPSCELLKQYDISQDR